MTREPNAFDAACAFRAEALRLHVRAFAARALGDDRAANLQRDADDADREAAHLVTRVTAKERP